MRLQSKSYTVDINTRFQIWWKKPNHSNFTSQKVRVPMSHRLMLPAKVWDTGDQEWYENGRLVKSRHSALDWEKFNIG